MRWTHLALSVADQMRSQRFYREVLGLRCQVREDSDGLLLTMDDGFVLALLDGEPPMDRDRVHFGFGLASPDEVRSTRERLNTEGVEEVEWHDLENFISMKFLDPDGYVLEVFWEKAG